MDDVSKYPTIRHLVLFTRPPIYTPKILLTPIEMRVFRLKTPLVYQFTYIYTKNV